MRPDSRGTCLRAEIILPTALRGVLRPHTRVRTLVISTPCVGLLAQLPVKRGVLRRRSPLARCRRPPRPVSRETDTKKLAAHSIRSAKHE